VNIMQKFYWNVIGLPLMTRVPNFAFFKMTDGYGGHTQVLAFFDCAQTPGYRRTNARAECLAQVKSKIEDARCQTNRILTSVGNIPRGGSRVGTPPEL
jgi:hypothetical protein